MAEHQKEMGLHFLVIPHGYGPSKEKLKFNIRLGHAYDQPAPAGLVQGRRHTGFGSMGEIADNWPGFLYACAGKPVPPVLLGDDGTGSPPVSCRLVVNETDEVPCTLNFPSTFRLWRAAALWRQLEPSPEARVRVRGDGDAHFKSDWSVKNSYPQRLISEAARCAYGDLYASSLSRTLVPGTGRAVEDACRITKVSAAAVSALPQRIAALTDLWNDDIAAAGHGQTMAKRGAGAMLSGIERHESMGLSAKAWRELTTPASSTPNANMIASPPETGNLLKTGFLQKLLVTCSQLGDDVAKSIGEDTYGKKKAAMFGALVTHPWMLDLLGLVLEGELLLATLPKGGSKITSLRIAQLEIEGTILNLRLGDWLATEVSSKGFPSCSGQKEKGLCGEGVLALKDGAVSYGWGQIDADRALLELAACANRISTQIVHGSDPTQVRANPAALTTKGMTFYMGNIGASVSELRLEKIKARARAQATSSNEPKPVQILTAKDLIVGYRPDVQLHMANLGSEAGGNRKWYSLTARRLGKLGFKHLHPTVSLDDIEETEGMITWVSKLAQEKGGKIEEYPLEEIFTWDNWSVVDPQPSATHSQDTLPSIGAFMNIRYLPTDLPPQRVGWAYRIGMRVVYADGRSLSVNDAAKLYEDKQEHAVIGEDGDYDGPVESVERFKPFLRYEPIQPPGSHFFDLPGQETHPSETSYLMVVRTTHLNSRRFTSAPSVRVLTPPRTSLDLAIRMGQFDDPRSREVLPKGAFRGVVLKEDGSFPAFRSHPSLGKGQAIDTVYRESLFAQSPKNPYLPDPWARRLMIAIYRRTDSAPVHIAYHEYYDERHVWPNCRPLRLLVTGHTGPASEIPSVGFRVEQTADSLSITLRAGEEFLLQAWHEITFEQLERSGAIDSLAHYVMQDPKGYSALGWVNRPESIADARRKIAAMLADFDKRVSFDFWSLLGKIGGSSGQTSNRAPQPKQMNFTSFWMINPSVDLTLVHSIDRPNWEPALVEKTPPASEDRRYAVAFGLNRQPGSTKVVLNGSVRFDRKSTERIDVQIESEEWIDGGPGTAAPVMSETRRDGARGLPVKLAPTLGWKGAGYKLELPPDNDLLFFAEHAINRGANPDGIQEVWTEFADGGARPARFMPVAVGRFAQFSSNVPGILNGQALETVIPASVLPAKPRVSYVEPFLHWERRSGGQTLDTISTGKFGPVSQSRSGRNFRIWLERPMRYGEKIAVVLGPNRNFEPLRRTAFRLNPNARIDPIPPEVEKLVSRIGHDPMHFEGTTLPVWLRPEDFPELMNVEGAIEQGTLVPARLPQEMRSASGNTADHRVALYLLQPVFDSGSDLYYVDLRMNEQNAYWPFMRIALATFQPHSIKNRDGVALCDLSPIVTQEMVQLISGRILTVSGEVQGGDKTNGLVLNLEVKLAGTAPRADDGWGGVPNVVEITVEKSRTQANRTEVNDSHLSEGVWIPAAEIGKPQYPAGGKYWEHKFKNIPLEVGYRYRVMAQEAEPILIGAKVIPVEDRARRAVYLDWIKL